MSNSSHDICSVTKPPITPERKKGAQKKRSWGTKEKSMNIPQKSQWAACVLELDSEAQRSVHTCRSGTRRSVSAVRPDTVYPIRACSGKRVYPSSFVRRCGWRCGMSTFLRVQERVAVWESHRMRVIGWMWAEPLFFLSTCERCCYRCMIGERADGISVIGCNS